MYFVSILNVKLHLFILKKVAKYWNGRVTHLSEKIQGVV